MWQKLVANLLKAIYESIDETPSNEQVMKELNAIKAKLEQQDIKMKQSEIFTVIVFSASVAVTGIGLGLSGFHSQAVGLIVIGVVVMGVGYLKHRKLGEKLKVARKQG